MIFTNYEFIKGKERKFDFGTITQVAFGYTKPGDKTHHGLFTALTCPDGMELKCGVNPDYTMGVTKSGKKRIVTAPKNKADDTVSFIIVSDPAISTIEKKKMYHDEIKIGVSDTSAVDVEVIGHTEYDYNVIVRGRSETRVGMYDVILLTFTKDCVVALSSIINGYEHEFKVDTATATISELSEEDLTCPIADLDVIYPIDLVAESN